VIKILDVIHPDQTSIGSLRISFVSSVDERNCIPIHLEATILTCFHIRSLRDFTVGCLRIHFLVVFPFTCDGLAYSGVLIGSFCTFFRTVHHLLLGYNDTFGWLSRFAREFAKISHAALQANIRY
jgi:hypothetical protein